MAAFAGPLGEAPVLIAARPARTHGRLFFWRNVSASSASSPRHGAQRAPVLCAAGEPRRRAHTSHHRARRAPEGPGQGPRRIARGTATAAGRLTRQHRSGPAGRASGRSGTRRSGPRRRRPARHRRAGGRSARRVRRAGGAGPRPTRCAPSAAGRHTRPRRAEAGRWPFTASPPARARLVPAPVADTRTSRGRNRRAPDGRAAARAAGAPRRALAARRPGVQPRLAPRMVGAATGSRRVISPWPRTACSRAAESSWCAASPRPAGSAARPG